MRRTLILTTWQMLEKSEALEALEKGRKEHYNFQCLLWVFAIRYTKMEEFELGFLGLQMTSDVR